MNVLLTGANGQLGRCIRDIAEKYPKNRMFYTDIEGKDVAHLDITDANQVRTFVRQNKIEAVVNCAASMPFLYRNADKDGIYSVNAEGPRNLAVAMKEARGLLLQMSCDTAVAVRPVRTPIRETDDAEPFGFLGWTKRQGEVNVQESGCLHVILRTSTLCSEYSTNLVSLIYNAQGEIEDILLSKQHTYSMTYAANVAEVIFRILNQYRLYKIDPLRADARIAQVFDIHNQQQDRTAGIFHYSSRGECTPFDVGQFVAELLHLTDMSVLSDEDYDFDDADGCEKVPPYSVLNSNKIHNTFGVQTPHWKDAVRQCVKHMQSAETPSRINFAPNYRPVIGDQPERHVSTSYTLTDFAALRAMPGDAIAYAARQADVSLFTVWKILEKASGDNLSLRDVQTLQSLQKVRDYCTEQRAILEQESQGMPYREYVASVLREVPLHLYQNICYFMQCSVEEMEVIRERKSASEHTFSELRILEQCRAWREDQMAFMRRFRELSVADVAALPVLQAYDGISIRQNLTYRTYLEGLKDQLGKGGEEMLERKFTRYLVGQVFRKNHLYEHADDEWPVLVRCVQLTDLKPWPHIAQFDTTNYRSAVTTAATHLPMNSEKWIAERCQCAAPVVRTVLSGVFAEATEKYRPRILDCAEQLLQMADEQDRIWQAAHRRYDLDYDEYLQWLYSFMKIGWVQILAKQLGCSDKMVREALSRKSPEAHTAQDRVVLQAVHERIGELDFS